MSVAFDLDNLEKIKSLDKQDMLGVEENFYLHKKKKNCRKSRY